MIKKISSILFLIFITSSLNASSFNYDDYEDLISYAVNPQVSNRKIYDWAKKILNSDTNAIPNLISHLNTVDARILHEIKYILINIDTPCVKPLINYISDTETSGNLTAIYVLGEIGDTIAYDKLYELLNSEYSRVRNFSALSIGKLNIKKSIPKLLELLSDTNEMVKKSATVSLGKLCTESKDAEIISRLLETISDTFYFVRYSAIEALQRFDTNTAAAAIFHKIKETSDTDKVRIYTKILSGFKLKNKEYLKLLKDLFFQTKDISTAKNIFDILKNSGIDIQSYEKTFKDRFKISIKGEDAK